MARISILFLLAYACSAFATHIAVLETSADGNAKEKVSLSDRQYLTNVLREQAIKELPAMQNFTIMTRENINAMLPPGKSIEDCEGSCLVETGRNISAEYVCQARVGSFGESLTLSAELYETAGNKLIASFNGHGFNVDKLLEIIKQNAPDFFKSVKDKSSGISEFGNISSDSIRLRADATYKELDNESENLDVGIPAQRGNNSETSGIHWIPLSISAAVAVTGVVLTIVGNNMAKDAADRGGSSEKQFQENIDDANSGQTLRGVGIGLAIVGGLGIGLSFAF